MASHHDMRSWTTSGNTTRILSYWEHEERNKCSWKSLQIHEVWIKSFHREVLNRSGLKQDLCVKLMSCSCIRTAWGQYGSCHGSAGDGVPWVLFPPEPHQAAVYSGEETSPHCKTTWDTQRKALVSWWLDFQRYFDILSWFKSQNLRKLHLQLQNKCKCNKKTKQFRKGHVRLKVNHVGWK